MDINKAQIYGSLYWDKNALNTDVPPSGEVGSNPIDIANEIKVASMNLKAAHMDEEGFAVDYKSLLESITYKEYVEKTRKLTLVDLSQLEDDNVKKAFFLNVYNGLIIHGIVAKCHQSIFGGMVGRRFFYTTTSYKIGEFIYSLDDIEHGILRCNKISPVPGSKPQFNENDPRLPFILKQFDPRIHFALNCGAKGCPPVAVYDADKIDKQLTVATKGFVRNCLVVTQRQLDNIISHTMEQQNQEGTGTSATGTSTSLTNTCYYIIQLSMIFKWYSYDFGCDDLEVLKFIIPFISPTTMNTELEIIQNIVKSDPTKEISFEIIHEPYNWAVNDM